MSADSLPPPLAADGPARLLAREGVQACLAALDGTCEEGCPLGADGRGAAKAGRRPSVGDEADARA